MLLLTRDACLSVAGVVWVMSACLGGSSRARHPCIDEQPCRGRPIPVCPVGLEPAYLFDPQPPIGPVVVVAHLQEAGVFLTDVFCDDTERCCNSGGGKLVLTSDITSGQAEVAGIQHSSLGHSELPAAIDFSFTDGTLPECGADETGTCCSIGREELENRGLVIVRGTRTAAAMISNADFCRALPKGYPGLTLQGTKVIHGD